MAHMKLTVGAPAIVIGGKNVGKYGKITAIEEKPNQKRRDLLVTIEDKNANRFQTTLNFIFVLGETNPSISLPEVD
jgi:small subunit ribosomal protein S4e